MKKRMQPQKAIYAKPASLFAQKEPIFCRKSTLFSTYSEIHFKQIAHFCKFLQRTLQKMIANLQDRPYFLLVSSYCLTSTDSFSKSMKI